MNAHGISSKLYGLTRLPPTAEQQEFRTSVRSLIDAIKNGDLDTAKEAFDKISEAKSSRTDEHSQASPFAKLIEKLGEALDANDTEAAKAALDDFEANGPKGPPPLPPLPSLTNGPSQDARDAFVALVESLRKDDLKGAKDAYDTLIELTSGDETDSKLPLDQFLEQVGAALDAEDLGGAKAALEQLARHRPPGGTLDVTT